MTEKNEDKKKIQKLREKLVIAKRKRGVSANSHHAHSQIVT
jgi:hypothetical protein